MCGWFYVSHVTRAQQAKASNKAGAIMTPAQKHEK